MFTLSDPRKLAQSEGPALIGTIDAAIALGTRCVYGTTGSAGGSVVDRRSRPICGEHIGGAFLRCDL